MMRGCVASLAVLLSGAPALTAGMKPGWGVFGSTRKETPKATAQRDLVFMHIPATLGHTVEKVAMFHENSSRQDMISLVASKGGTLEKTVAPLTWTDVMTVAKADAEVWGRMSPQLQWTSDVTGCNLYHTPQKYWPERNAKRYFRNMTVFGLLRDPYERLIALFRADPDRFAGKYGKLTKRCDVNAAISQVMKKYIDSGDQFMEACALIPQSEYFEGPYGITLPIDGRKFPGSVNAAFKEHGYGTMQIRKEDIFTAKDCPNAWAGDLDMHTKQMVRQVYARDFELLCKRFGYCNSWENTCTEGVPEMCPKNVVAQLQMRRFWGLSSKI